MAAIEKLKIKGFKAFPNEFELNLNGNHLLIYGENGSGKSSIYYALHCLFQSPLKKDSGRKYFNSIDDQGNENHQHLLNLNCKNTDDSYISVSFTEKHPFIYSINKDGYNTKLVGGHRPLPKNITGVFINHKFLFHFFNFRNSEQINLFPVFEKDILPFVLDQKSNLHIGEMYDELISSVIKKGNRVAPEYISNIDYFNDQVAKLTEEINLRSSDIYNTYFREDNDKHLIIKLHFHSNHNKPFGEYRQYYLKYDYQLEQINENGKIIQRQAKYKSLNKPFIALEIAETKEHGEQRGIAKPQAYFNEAKLTAIALSIRFSLLNLDAPADGRFLALDDMLISLDMSNRTKVIEFLLSISDKYKIYLFTHDRAFFELAKNKINYAKKDYGGEWLFKELYNDGNPINNPKCYDSETAYSRAIKHFNEFDYPASANYLRKAVEDLITIFPPYISKDDNGTNKEKLRSKLDAAFLLLKRLDNNTKGIVDIIHALNLLLNPLSHRSIDTNIYRSELSKIIDLIPQIEKQIINLNIKEEIAQKKIVLLCIVENPNTSCKIEIELTEALYSYVDSNGNRKLSIVNGESRNSITITNGKEGDPKKHEYNKGSLEEICKQVHSNLGKEYNGDYLLFYSDSEGNSLI